MELRGGLNCHREDQVLQEYCFAFLVGLREDLRYDNSGVVTPRGMRWIW